MQGPTRESTVLIIGGGFPGAGTEDVVLLEQAGTLGGVRRENTGAHRSAKATTGIEPVYTALQAVA